MVLVNGTITETGTYQQLLHNKGAFAEFLRQYLTDEGEHLDDEDPEAAALKDQVSSL